MKANRMIFTAAIGIPLLAGCASMNPGSSLAWTVKPVNSITASATPEDFYRLGRYYQGEDRLEPAAQAYRQALSIDAGYAEANNGLGVIYSMQGKYPEAIAAFKSALKRAPKSAYIYNNLGYAYYLHGQYQESLSALKQANALSGNDPKILDNLGLAYSKVRATSKSMHAFMRAAEIEQAAHAASPPPASRQAAAPASGVTLALPKDRGVIIPASFKQVIPLRQSRMDWVRVSQNVYELREAGRTDAPGKTARTYQTEVSGKIARAYRIEVSNGNGVDGMARRMGHDLLDRGFPVTRYTNQRPFDVRASEIQFRDGRYAEANRLNNSLPMKMPLVKNNRIRRDIGVRLVLGKDIASGKRLLSWSMKSPHSAKKRKS